MLIRFSTVNGNPRTVDINLYRHDKEKEHKPTEDNLVKERPEKVEGILNKRPYKDVINKGFKLSRHEVLVTKNLFSSLYFRFLFSTMYMNRIQVLVYYKIVSNIYFDVQIAPVNDQELHFPFYLDLYNMF